jgi:hypothetical protein
MVATLDEVPHGMALIHTTVSTSVRNGSHLRYLKVPWQRVFVGFFKIPVVVWEMIQPPSVCDTHTTGPIIQDHLSNENYTV